MKPILASQIGMNSTERKYCEMLSFRKAAGEIVDYVWEPFKLILVHGVKKARNEMSYKPDFLVVMKDRFEVHEVKGFWQEDARLKIKMAADQFRWFKFVAVTLKGKKWVYEEF